MRFTKADLLRLFELLDAELGMQNVVGEVYVVGGAVMCLALGARDATRDVDAWFRPARLVPEDWLNDAVKGFLSPRGTFDDYLELPHLRVFVAQPSYLLAMKCAAMRLGEEFHDVDDVRYLLRYLNITTAAEAMDLVTMYFDASQLPPKTRFALEELLPE